MKVIKLDLEQIECLVFLVEESINERLIIDQDTNDQKYFIEKEKELLEKLQKS